jgi:hypothetical protein
MDLLKLGIDQIVEVSGESRSIVHDAIRAGDLKTFLVGRRRFARPESVREWIAFLERERDAGRPVSYRGRNQSRVDPIPRAS